VGGQNPGGSHHNPQFDDATSGNSMFGSHTLSWQDYPPPTLEGGAVLVGNFDGVHLGHRALVTTAVALGKPVVALTFDPHPQRVLMGEMPPPLMRLSDRIATLRSAGVDAVAILRTTPELLALSPEAFFEEILLRRFRSRVIVEGYNFRFGRARTGDIHTLRSLCEIHGVHFEVVPPAIDAGEPISSSRVRSGLLAGDVVAVRRWLARAYDITGRVILGQQRGRTLGFPTANLGAIETLLPAEGVYAVWAIPEDGTRCRAAANIGPNPTFGEDARKIEVHLLDFQGDLYGRTMRVEFVQRLRATQPFRGVEALVEQLQRDIAETRNILETSV